MPASTISQAHGLPDMQQDAAAKLGALLHG
jgi:hypothetical protein